MRPRLFPSARVVLVIHGPAMDSSYALPDEKIHRSHLVRYTLGLVLRIISKNLIHLQHLQLRLWHPTTDFQKPYRNRQPEPARAGASGIDEQHPALLLHDRPV